MSEVQDAFKGDWRNVVQSRSTGRLSNPWWYPLFESREWHFCELLSRSHEGECTRACSCRSLGCSDRRGVPNMTEIRIAEYSISKESPPFVIAEVGINHNGEIEKAYAMIKVAKEAGADAVKFQTFKAEEFVGDPEMTFTYRSQGREVTE